MCSSAGKLRIVAPALRQRFETAATAADVSALTDEFIAAVRDGSYAARGWPKSMYGVSKLAEAAWSRGLAARLAGTGVIVSACNPGWCATDMSSWSGPLTAAQGADTPVWLALASAGFPSGKFWDSRAESDY